MRLKLIAKCALLGLTLTVSALHAQDSVTPKPRLTIGGYGEAVYTRNFYSDNMFRYSHPERYKDSPGHGRVDLPHVVINLGYDFGKGWSMGSEIEFEHGGNEVAVEIEAEETGEFERAYCHRPSWQTGDDMFTDPTGFFADGDPRLPRYPNQKIWPYSDYIQHQLHMENDIRTGWCRTTPLWGRGLSAICTGRRDRLHDCRAQTVIEAIMWHGNAQSDARRTVEKFRLLDKKDRDAVVKFIEAI